MVSCGSALPGAISSSGSAGLLGSVAWAGAAAVPSGGSPGGSSGGSTSGDGRVGASPGLLSAISAEGRRSAAPRLLGSPLLTSPAVAHRGPAILVLVSPHDEEKKVACFRQKAPESDVILNKKN